MIWHVVHALAQSRFVERIVIIGLGSADVNNFAGIDFSDHPVHYLPDQGGMFDNVVHSFEWLAKTQAEECYALLLTGDIPLLTGAMLDWFVNACQPLTQDVYWGIVEKQTMEATFPNSKRSYLRLVEGQFCSGDLFLGKISVPLKRQVLIQQMLANRKSVIQQLRLLGISMIVKFLLHRLRLPDLLGRVHQILNLTGGAIILPFAEVGMDVDKPHQLAQVLAYLAQHPRPLVHPSNEAETPHG